MTDQTEAVRREMLEEARANGPMTREELAALHGDVYDTGELQDAFSVEGFMAPFCVVKRKADGKRGSLQFQHSPRFYFGFVADNKR